MKYDVTTSHTFTQHWDVKARNKDEAAEKVMGGDIKFDKTSRTYVSNKLTRTLVTIPDALILSIEATRPEDRNDAIDRISYGGTMDD